jgi:plasmid stability protein
MTDQTTTFNIRHLPAQLHRQLKIRAAAEGKPLEKLIIELILLASNLTGGPTK